MHSNRRQEGLETRILNARSNDVAQGLCPRCSQSFAAQSQRFAPDPSDAARAAGVPGFNLVIFQDSVLRPDRVRILGPTKKPFEQWP